MFFLLLPQQIEKSTHTKTMSQSNDNQTAIDGIQPHCSVTTATTEQPPHFTQFTIVGWSKVFDYLSFPDIIALSETCIQMQQIVGEYFRKKFHGTACCFDGSGPSFDMCAFDRQDFLRYVDTVQINGQMEDLEQFPYVNLYDSITSLQLCFFCTEEFASGFENISNGNIECVELYRCSIQCDLYEIFLKNCPKLQHLRIDKTYFEPISGGIKSIFDHNYPALQRLQYTRNDEESDLCRFLEQNPSVKCLQIDGDDFWSNRNALETSSNMKRRGLDCLVIEIESTAIEPVEFTNVLKAFHEHGFYKKLHLAIYWISDDFEYQPLFDGMQSLPTLEVLYTDIFNENIVHLTNLRELHLMELDGKIDLKPLALNLNKIERLWIEGTANQLHPFVCNSKLLNAVVFELKDRNDNGDDDDNNNNGLNLVAMNREREKLQPAGKVSIGVDENTYLKTKWMVKNSKLNFNWIELARKETICEHFDFKHRIVDCT